MSDQRPRFLRLVIAGTRVRCTGLKVEPVEHQFRLTITGWMFPDELRSRDWMGTEIMVVSQLPETGAEHQDVFVVQEALGATEDREGRFELRVQAVHLKKLSGA